MSTSTWVCVMLGGLYTSKYLTVLLYMPFCWCCWYMIWLLPSESLAFQHLLYVLAAELLRSKNSGVAEALNAIRMLFRKAGWAIAPHTYLLLHFMVVLHYFCFTRSPNAEWDWWFTDGTAEWWPFQGLRLTQRVSKVQVAKFESWHPFVLLSSFLELVCGVA